MCGKTFKNYLFLFKGWKIPPGEVKTKYVASLRVAWPLIFIWLVCLFIDSYIV